MRTRPMLFSRQQRKLVLFVGTWEGIIWRWLILTRFSNKYKKVKNRFFFVDMVFYL
jgi:hypothetical protein